MTLFEVIIHLILWPFNAAVYTYGVLALMTGVEPSIDVVLGAGVGAFLLGLALAARRGGAPAPNSTTGRSFDHSPRSHRRSAGGIGS